MVVKIIGFSFNEPKFNSRHPHDVSQLPVTPVLGISDALFWLLRGNACTWCTNTHADDIPTHETK